METQITPEEAPKVIHQFTGDVEQWRDLVSKYFPVGVVDEALLIVLCESHGDPNAINSSGASGLFQIIPLFHSEKIASRDIFNAEVNIDVASQIYNDSQWNLWSCKP